MPLNPQNPLVVQSDRTVLLEVQNDYYEEARDALARFAELEKSPEYLHTYRITPLSLWNAAAAGMTAAEMLGSLDRYSKYDVPGNVRLVHHPIRRGALEPGRRSIEIEGALVGQDADEERRRRAAAIDLVLFGHRIRAGAEILDVEIVD